jgi:hypothetical protein
MYDANLVFSESFDIEGVAFTQVGSSSIDLGSDRDVTGTAGLFMELEVLEKPTTASVAAGFNFVLLGSNDADGTDPVIYASSPLFGSPQHVPGLSGPTFPEVGAKILVPINTTLNAYQTANGVNTDSYGRRYLSVFFVNVVYVVSSANGGLALGIMGAGKFRVSLRMGSPNHGRAYPGGY